MTHLRKMMLEELQRHHYSEATAQRYIRFVERGTIRNVFLLVASF